MKLTEKDVNGQTARALRESLDLGQSAFWNPLGVHQSTSSKYEAGQAKIPKPVRILVIANYVAGIKIDASSSEAVESLARLGHIQSKDRDLKKSAARAIRALDSASAELAGARETIQSI